MASKFTVSELPVLGVVANEIARAETWALPVGAIAALSGTSRRTVQNAIGFARGTGLLRVLERRRQNQRNLPNLITLLPREWSAWIAKAQRIGRINAQPMSTRGSNQEKAGPVEVSKMTIGEADRRLGGSGRVALKFARGG